MTIDRKSVVSLLIASCAALTLSACAPPRAAQPDDPQAGLIEEGYSRAPQVTEVHEVEGEWHILGISAPDVRVRLESEDAKVSGFTSDSKGRFHAIIPVRSTGTVLQLSAEDRERYVQADGRIFLPAGAPQRAVMLRAGAPALGFTRDGPVISVADIDSSGAIAIMGHVEPGASVEVTLNGMAAGGATAGTDGVYHLLTAVPSAPTVRLSVTSKGITTTQVVGLPAPDDLSRDAASEARPTESFTRIEVLPQAWRVTWPLPGGGQQTSYVFK